MLRCLPRNGLLAGSVLTIVFLLVSSTSLPAQALPLNLRQMVDASGRIFTGTVVDVRGGTDENDDIVTFTTFMVERTIKGAPASMVTIKQFGGDFNGLSTKIMDMRYFQPGERVLVILYPNSDMGFTSPIGMNQGAWTVDQGMLRGVSLTVLEGIGSMAADYGLHREADGSVQLENFIAMISGIVAEDSGR